jgi:alkanesulfonate monooxygenase SsuD/methylene tetrahydromethanopterin reductase-like flavin-dependent oxidoreductase (luciferase family)
MDDEPPFEPLEHLDVSAVNLLETVHRGRRGRNQPPIDDIETYWSPAEKALAMQILARSIVGGTDAVRDGLAALLSETGADELMVVSDIYDHSARLHSYDLIAAAHAEKGDVSMMGAVA